MNAPVAVAARQLLKNIHIAKLDIIMFIDMISKAQEKTVLVKVIIDDLFPEIYMHFIIYNK